MTIYQHLSFGGQKNLKKYDIDKQNLDKQYVKK